MGDKAARAYLKFNEYDFRHRKVLEILRSKPRNQTELVVNAVLHYISCPDAAVEFDRNTLRQMIREVIIEMQADGSIGVIPQTGKPSAPEQITQEDSAELGGLMAAFRQGK